MNGHDNRYAYAYIDFATIDGCNQALRHNYSESARKWDGTDVRKLASLLRECKKADTGNSDFTNNDKVNQILRDYLKSVNSYLTRVQTDNVNLAFSKNFILMYDHHFNEIKV